MKLPQAGGSETSGSRVREPAGGPLRHVRICDLTGQLAGAGATRLLAALGAEVIRVEDPSNDGAWDLLRVAGPFPDGVQGTNRSVSFNNHNVGKLGVTINLRTPQGRQLLTDLIACSDAVTENFAAGVFARLGFPYEVLREIREDIVYVSNSGFGASGPNSQFKTWGPIVQAFSGLTFTSRLPGSEPAGWGYSFMDHLGAWYMAVAVLAGLYHRDRTGRGQWIDMSCTDAGVNLLGPLFLDHTVNRRRIGDDPMWSSNRSHSPVMAPHGIYPAKGDDRWVALACCDDDHWARLAGLIAQPWARGKRFEALAGRCEREDVLDQLIGAWTAARDPWELVATLRAIRVPASVVASPKERIDDDPGSARWGLWPEVLHSELGKLRVDGLPVHLSETDWSITKGAPCLGEDNVRVLGGLLGRSAEELEILAEEGHI
jgi:crotonobetainyl-CoA:carnitine CoA-transferase CaiB-like acyl-CoA transferase